MHHFQHSCPPFSTQKNVFSPVASHIFNLQLMLTGKMMAPHTISMRSKQMTVGARSGLHVSGPQRTAAKVSGHVQQCGDRHYHATSQHLVTTVHVICSKSSASDCVTVLAVMCNACCHTPLHKHWSLTIPKSVTTIFLAVGLNLNFLLTGHVDCFHSTLCHLLSGS